MTATLRILLTTIACCLLPWVETSSSSSSSSSCPPGMLAVYRLNLATEWSEEKFPKQYPQWRPPAQWSKTVGLVHSVSSPLFSLGSTVSEGARQFAETGATDKMEMETVNKTFLDAVLAPPILSGVGQTNTTIFVDSNHTKISVMTKLVPSPDWFIGLDSLDLCSQGAFLDSVITEASPLDGGTDNGFTFTSPNWATQPPDEVFTITSSYPAHPAGSFNYPHLNRLPTLAVYSLTKLREYSLQQEYDQQDPSQPVAQPLAQNKLEAKFQYDLLKTETAAAKDKIDNDVIEFVPVEKGEKLSPKVPVVTNEIPAQSVSSPQYSVKNKRNFLGSKPAKGFRSLSSLTGYHASTSPENFFKKKYVSEHLNKAEKRIFQDLKSVPKSELYRQIMNSYLGNDIKKKKKKRRRRKKKFRNKKSGRHHKKTPKDCRVSSWSGWGGCSKTCGIGETIRTRVIENHPAHGGRPCPPLREFKWCGSARNCNKGYFNW